jgi:glucose-6-phosphate dehydrogenase assembly protein OpcA
VAEGVTVVETGTVSWQGSNVDVTTVERQLSKLWAELSTESSLTAAVRTSVFNLVVFTTDVNLANRISDDLAHLGQRNPSRAIILICNRLHPRTAINVSANIYCQGATTSGAPLCHEQIVVRARGRAADHLGSVVIPLLLPELPTYLWWPGQPPFGHRTFHRLLNVTDQLVVDSAQFSSPGDGFANLARLCTGHQGVNDFNWRRLTPWREVIAQFFDGAAWTPYVTGIRSVKLVFGSGESDFFRATAGTLLLLGWIGTHLGWEPETTLDGLATHDVSLSVIQGERLIPIEIRFRDRGAGGVGRLLGVELVSQPKELPPARFSIEREADMGHARISMRIHEGTELTRVVPLEVETDMELLADELEMTGHDRLYEKVVGMASRMAGRELWMPV